MSICDNCERADCEMRQEDLKSCKRYKPKEQEFKKEDYRGGCTIMKCNDFRDNICYYEGDVCKYREEDEIIESLRVENQALRNDYERTDEKFMALCVKYDNRKAEIERLKEKTCKEDRCELNIIIDEERGKIERLKDSLKISTEGHSRSIGRVQELEERGNGLVENITTKDEMIRILKQEKAELVKRIDELEEEKRKALKVADDILAKGFTGVGEQCPSCSGNTLGFLGKCTTCNSTVCGDCVYGESGSKLYYCKSCWDALTKEKNDEK